MYNISSPNAVVHLKKNVQFTASNQFVTRKILRDVCFIKTLVYPTEIATMQMRVHAYLYIDTRGYANRGGQANQTHQLRHNEKLRKGEASKEK